MQSVEMDDTLSRANDRAIGVQGGSSFPWFYQYLPFINAICSPL